MTDKEKKEALTEAVAKTKYKRKPFYVVKFGPDVVSRHYHLSTDQKKVIILYLQSKTCQIYD